jgi:plastocyanin domain-containing protein
MDRSNRNRSRILVPGAVILVLAIAGLAIARMSVGPGGAHAGMPEAAEVQQAQQAQQAVAVNRIAVEVTARGFLPDTISLVAGQPTELVFTRTTPSGCAAEVHSPDLGIPITRLPQGEPVTIRVAHAETGSFTFLCGMDMFRGTIVVRATG